MCITGDANIKANSGECSTFESKPDAFLPYVLFVLSLYRDLVPVQIQNLCRGRRYVETSCSSILFCNSILGQARLDRRHLQTDVVS